MVQTIIYAAAAMGNVPDLFVIRQGTSIPQPLGQPRTHLLSVFEDRRARRTHQCEFHEPSSLYRHADAHDDGRSGAAADGAGA
jgi:hypothetical protein